MASGHATRSRRDRLPDAASGRPCGVRRPSGAVPGQACQSGAAAGGAGHRGTGLCPGRSSGFHVSGSGRGRHPARFVHAHLPWGGSAPAGLHPRSLATGRQPGFG
ncbi:hypothetical protein G6F59_016151 [Rhizopus arrhizus]|nr:hypothetical protein G6F59_016151 [Rhizopus arrhizus]